MRTHSPENERIKRQYFAYLKEAKRYSEASLDMVAKSLDRFEVYTRHRDFKVYHIQQAVGFKRHLAEQDNVQTGERLSKATLYSTLTALKNFFIWLAGQPGYRSRLSYADAEYFNLSEKESRIAKARREQRVPTLEQIGHVIDTMPAETLIQRRNRALVAFIILTGARDAAVASFKLKHVDLQDGHVLQDAREVKTKFSKTFTTWFFPVDEAIRQVVEDWVKELRTRELWSPDDPLFPATRVEVGESGQFEAVGLERKHWNSAGPIREVFKRAFTGAGLPYANPHVFRKTLAQLGERLCQTPEEFKAWSQNLGHEGVLTTLTSYGEVAPTRQAQIIRDLAKPSTLPVQITDDMRRLVLNLAEKMAFPP
ncbi:MAG TPA: tyrosine-type recombinase/integrase [Microvirga sp.]|jgi:integrase